MPEPQPVIGDPLTNIPSNVRHFAWNDDYIELLAQHLHVHTVKRLVDVGSGLGGLPGLFGLYMKPGSKVQGYDLDPQAVEQAQSFAAAHPYSVKFEFAVADPHQLPLEDGVADMAICQHVLAQVADPQRVLAELARVVRPGGRVVAFEPNNLAQAMVADSVEDGLDLAERLRAVRYQHHYEAGKRKLGLGDDSIGDRLPALFHALGLTRIEVRLSDKSAALVPPYDTPEKQARVRELLEWPRSFAANQEHMRRCFLAGGGDEAEFAAFIAWEQAQHAKIRQQLDEGRFIHPGGMLTYIVIGTKPA